MVNPKIEILIDDVDTRPANDFEPISETISNLIKNSEPHFTIGIYGEWGTGKTTLMKIIEKKLTDTSVNDNERHVLTVWFNAWRYEREEQYATIALMKAIGYAMADHEKFDEVSNTIFRGVKILGKDLLRRVAEETFMTEKGIEEFETKLTEKMEFLNKLERQTIYYDGLEEIKNQIKKIRKKKTDKDYRVVVFIDDLDRCSPKKALEVLESVKVFLDLDGFVYVIGLSHDTIDRLITKNYEATGIKGKDYIKKIIQVPIKLPKWYRTEIEDLIKNKIAPKLGADYLELLENNSSVIARVVESNPRQLKRFINSLIIAFETFGKGTDLTLRNLFFIQILKNRFPELYSRISKSSEYRKIASTLLDKWHLYKRYSTNKFLSPGSRLGISPRSRSIELLPDDIKFFDFLNSETNEEDLEKQVQTRRELLRVCVRPLRTPRTQSALRTHNPIATMGLSNSLAVLTNDDWNFLGRFRSAFDDIKNWDLYDNATELVEDISYESFLMNPPP